jgi:hypothetical protein
MPRILLVIASAIVLSTWNTSLAQSDAAVASPQQTIISSQSSLLGFSLEKDTLDDVRAKLGNSKIRKCSRVEEASNEICYIGSDRTIAVFEAGFSGGWTKLDGYKIVSAQLNPLCYRLCSASNLVKNDLTTVAGVKLGLTRQQVVQVLGQPTHATRNKLTFESQLRRPMTTEQMQKGNKASSSVRKDTYWDVVDTVDLILSNDRVIEIIVHRTVTD